MDQGYTIKIKQFEGPFDLLLFFIERDELDIYDIDISKITDDFLAYIRELEELNLDVASEFILVAATLMRIKARMLIPRKQVDEEGNEIDPREELVQKLIEYKRYKSVLEELRGLEEDRRKRHARGNPKQQLTKIASKALVDLELESLTLFNLMKAFQRVLDRYEDRKNRTQHTIVVYKYTIKEQQQDIRSKIRLRGESNFDTIFFGLDNRMHAIFTFLALLELLNAHHVQIIEAEGINNFVLTLTEAGDKIPLETKPEIQAEEE